MQNICRTWAEVAPARRTLTRSQVLTTALTIVDNEGVQALSMRRLGRALDCSPMAIYHYAADKDALPHPNVVPLVVTRPLSIPLFRWPAAALQALEDQLDLLIHAGFDEPGALQAARLFNGFLYGHVLHELHEQNRDREIPEAVLRFGPGGLPTRQFPRLRPFISVLSTRGGAADLDVGVTVLITVLREQLRAETGCITELPQQSE